LALTYGMHPGRRKGAARLQSAANTAKTAMNLLMIESGAIEGARGAVTDADRADRLAVGVPPALI